MTARAVHGLNVCGEVIGKLAEERDRHRENQIDNIVEGVSAEGESHYLACPHREAAFAELLLAVETMRALLAVLDQGRDAAGHYLALPPDPLQLLKRLHKVMTAVR